jgi:hypothetical protein
MLGFELRLTVANKTSYEVEKQEHSDGNWLIVKCDDGIRRLFTKDVFESISEFREKRLNELGI